MKLSSPDDIANENQSPLYINKLINNIVDDDGEAFIDIQVNHPRNTLTSVLEEAWSYLQRADKLGFFASPVLHMIIISNKMIT